MAETGRFYKAGSKYEKAYHKTKSKDFQALAAIKAGQVNQNVNRLKEAYNWLRKAERANPQMPEIYLKVAQLAVMNDDTATAREYIVNKKHCSVMEKETMAFIIWNKWITI